MNVVNLKRYWKNACAKLVKYYWDRRQNTVPN
jgi:hypothetical protein